MSEVGKGSFPYCIFLSIPFLPSAYEVRDEILLIFVEAPKERQTPRNIRKSYLEWKQVLSFPSISKAFHYLELCSDTGKVEHTTVYLIFHKIIVKLLMIFL